MSQESSSIPLAPRQISLASHPAVDFIDNRLDGKFHPAFGRSDVIFNKELDQYIGINEIPEMAKGKTQTVSSTREMKSQKEMFISAVKEYERNCKHKTGVDLRRAHNWSEVLGKINDAREK